MPVSKYTVRTSDRRTFRRCLRKWDYQSSLRQNLQRAGTEQNINFWFGTAIHFCMEDYHGYNKFQDPRIAFYSYYNAFPEAERPAGAEMHYKLGMSMLSYYMEWMQFHNKTPQFETVWFKKGTNILAEPNSPGAEPAVEVEFSISLGVYAIIDDASEKIIHAFTAVGKSAYETRIYYNERGLWLPQDWEFENSPETVYYWRGSEERNRVRIVPIQYHGTIDRIVKDRYGRIWLWDYKTAKSADTAKLDTDDQVSAYLWAATKLFDFPVYGFVYLQMTKAEPRAPKRLKTGELSCDKRQSTTYSLYRKELIQDYGEVNKAPSKMIDTLNHFASLETPEGDRFIRWDFVKRTPEQLQNTERAIYGELRIMLDNDLYCYPSPTRDCIWDCPYRDLCIAQDREDESAYSEFLREFQERPRSENGNKDDWRAQIAWPGEGIKTPSLEEVLNCDIGTTLDIVMEDTDDAFKFYYEDNN